MESHISHIFADLFTSRPKAYSKNGLMQLLKLRLLKVNGKDIKKEYLNQYKKKEIYMNKSNELFRSKQIETDVVRNFFKNPIDNYINFIY